MAWWKTSEFTLPPSWEKYRENMLEKYSPTFDDGDASAATELLSNKRRPNQMG